MFQSPLSNHKPLCSRSSGCGVRAAPEQRLCVPAVTLDFRLPSPPRVRAPGSLSFRVAHQAGLLVTPIRGPCDFSGRSNRGPIHLGPTRGRSTMTSVTMHRSANRRDASGRSGRPGRPARPRWRRSEPVADAGCSGWSALAVRRVAGWSETTAAARRISLPVVLAGHGAVTTRAASPAPYRSIGYLQGKRHCSSSFNHQPAGKEVRPGSDCRVDAVLRSMRAEPVSRSASCWSQAGSSAAAPSPWQAGSRSGQGPGGPHTDADCGDGCEHKQLCRIA
jgi:hypothetical protein